MKMQKENRKILFCLDNALSHWKINLKRIFSIEYHIKMLPAFFRLLKSIRVLDVIFLLSSVLTINYKELLLKSGFQKNRFHNSSKNWRGAHKRIEKVIKINNRRIQQYLLGNWWKSDGYWWSIYHNAKVAGKYMRVKKKAMKNDYQ